jgi:hypothetical protein
MNTGAKKFIFAALAFWFGLALADVTAQLPAAGPGATMGAGTNLSSVMYFEPPHDQQVEMRLSGAQMTPLPGVALYDVKKLKIETFNVAGKPEAVVEAPECTYAQLEGVANSAGPLDMVLEGGKIHVQGQGFLWQQTDRTLDISNQVRTVIKMGTWKLTTP